MIHRAVFGSFERFIGILVENYQGAFPVWLSPIQARILTVGEQVEDYGEKIRSEFSQNGIRVEIDNADETVGKKIRNAELEKIPYILVVGKKEEESRSVAVRRRGEGDLGALKLSAAIEKIKKEIENKI